MEVTARKRIISLSVAIEELEAAVREAEDRYSSVPPLDTDGRRKTAQRLMAIEMGRQALVIAKAQEEVAR
jgi:hypothetical protein